ncbi:hypothetical protein NGRA_2197 [Nosema granulosis]|uniref:Uncharacterized protein n=1 Tax=Nosema granulosis TaxID=83296 RepID=A0A9P6GXZ8_9MICR|nr:hypothetical protein NGRA_2197 [Nosema granulosis]
MCFNNLTVKNINGCNFVLYCEENYLVLLNNDTGKYHVVEHDKKILYVWDTYFSDLEKNVFEIDLDKLNIKKVEKHEDLKKIEICELKKLLENQNVVVFYKSGCVAKHVRKIKKNLFKATGKYLMNTFGNCLVNGDKILTGTLCGVIDCCSNSNYIFIADKYKRIRVVDEHGKIIRFIFVASDILKMVNSEEKLYVLTKESLETYEILSGRLLGKKPVESSLGDSLILSDDKIYFVKSSNLLNFDQEKIESDGFYLNYLGNIITIKNNCK